MDEVIEHFSNAEDAEALAEERKGSSSAASAKSFASSVFDHSFNYHSDYYTLSVTGRAECATRSLPLPVLHRQTQLKPRAPTVQ